MKKEILLTVLLAIFGLHISAQEQKILPERSIAEQLKQESTSLKSDPILTECSGEIQGNSQEKKWAVKLRPTIVKHFEFEDVRKIKNKKLTQKFSQSAKLQSETPETANALSCTPVIGTNFEANWMVNGTPSDNSMAISNGGYIVTANNDGVEYYNTSGSFLYFDFWSDFFGNDPQLTATIYDPKVLYDSGSDRFIMVVLHGSTASTSKVIVCFSKTNNPQNGWWYYKLTGNPLNDNSWFDYPNIGVSNNEFYVTGNLFYNSGGSNQTVLYQIQKSAGFSGGSLSWQYWSNISGSPFGLFPLSKGQQGNYGPGIYLVATYPNWGLQVKFFDLTDDMTASNEQLNNYSVSTSSYDIGSDAAQQGSGDLLDVGDCRVVGGFYLNGIAHFVFHSDIGSGYNGINYNRLTVSNLTNQSATLGLSGTYDYCYPNIASFATTSTDKSVMIGFLRTGSSIYPQVRVINCDNNMNWSSSSSVKAGETYVNVLTGDERWGDYSGMSRKHNNASATVWMTGCYGANIPSQNTYNTWKTWVSEVTCGSSSSVSEHNQDKYNTSVYPNPVYDFFSIKFIVEKNTETTISIYDEQGKLVKLLYKDVAKSGENIFTFNKSALTNGTYFIIINDNQKTIANEKIIVLN